MYNYSPIKEIRIRNFRNLGDVSLDFTESPIISLVGENESGKTSVVKAFGVCAAHQDPRSQKDFIRDGTNGFGVAIELEDGTLITRMKTTTANVYRVQNADGTVWEANKLEYTVPKAVSDVMGLIEEKETKELLQIRTYEDQLLFVITPASTNYKVMYDALKISQLTRAIKVGNTEVNDLKSKINTAEHSIDTLESSLRKIRIFDLEPAINIKNKLINDLSILDKLDKALSLNQDIKQKRKQIGTIDRLFIDNIQPIDEVTVTRVNQAARILEEIRMNSVYREAYKPIIGQNDIDINAINNIEQAFTRRENLINAKNQSKCYTDLYNANGINEMAISLLDRANEVRKSLKNQISNLSVIDIKNAESIDDARIQKIYTMESATELKSKIVEYKKYEKQLVSYVEQIVQWLKSIGVATTDCPNCGESVIIDLDLLSGKN